MEALKLGDRIAIMKDGAFVQVGTPEEVVAHPADDYVADFIRDVPRTHVLTARTIMEPVSRGNGQSYASDISPDTVVQDLLPLVVNSGPAAPRHRRRRDDRRRRSHRGADRDAGGRRLMSIGVGQAAAAARGRGRSTERVGRDPPRPAEPVARGG